MAQENENDITWSMEMIVMFPVFGSTSNATIYMAALVSKQVIPSEMRSPDCGFATNAKNPASVVRIIGTTRP